MSKKPRRVCAGWRKSGEIYFLRRHVRRRKYFAACKCGNWPLTSANSCAWQAVSLLEKCFALFQQTIAARPGTAGAGRLIFRNFFFLAWGVFSSGRLWRPLPRRREEAPAPAGGGGGAVGGEAAGRRMAPEAVRAHGCVLAVSFSPGQDGGKAPPAGAP